MQEYVSDAIILNKEPLRDLDGRYSFFTEKFGKITGKATSSRKITSKLSAHLEPGNLSRIRFVEKGGTQIVDALKISRIPISITDLSFLNDIVPDVMPETELWDMLTKGTFSWNSVLRILGWDPEGAECTTGHPQKVTHFYITRQEFFCSSCALKLPKNRVLSL